MLLNKDILKLGNNLHNIRKKLLTTKYKIMRIYYLKRIKMIINKIHIKATFDEIKLLARLGML